jgi:SAM-dependent methyltransferase
MSAAFAAKLVPLLPRDLSVPILEIGCGVGYAVAALQELGFRNVEGIDADRGQIASATARELPVTHVPTSETLAFLAARERSYDAVIAIDVIEHIPIDVQLPVLQHIVAALKPGGTLICQVPNASSGISSHYRYIDWTHCCSFTRFSLDFILDNAGLTDIRVIEADPPRCPRLPFILRKSVFQWLIRGAFRFARRLEYYAELGWPEARRIPLTPNIIAISRRPL